MPKTEFFSRTSDFCPTSFHLPQHACDDFRGYKSIRASFERRGVGVPQDVPFALTEEFLGDPQKTREWNALVSRLYPGSASPSLEEVGVLLRAFLLPCVVSMSAAESTADYWTPGLHWSEQQ